MKVCIIAEGCYPYVVGGVSSWIHSMISTFSDISFSLIAIISDRSQSGKFEYTLLDNLTDIYEVYLSDDDWNDDRRGTADEKYSLFRYNAELEDAITSLIMNENVKWESIFRMAQDRKFSINKLLMSPVFLHAAEKYYESEYQSMPFTDFLWTLRSIYAPMFLSLRTYIPQADIYHCIATGYSGLIGSMAKLLNPSSRLIISEHGIYTREREEELIKAKWVRGTYKDIWIRQFYKMSQCAYDYADLVTSLFEHARNLQVEFGCPIGKTLITPNGIKTDHLMNLKPKEPDDQAINVGAILRITPIKDIKTMIMAYHEAHKIVSQLKLWIMGPDNEDPEYAQECRDLAQELHEENIVFTGRINIVDYLGKMDFLILTSISEGQPLTILEGYAAGKPSLTTNVGNCYGLIYGEDGDTLGDAGIVVPIMNVQEIAAAMVRMAQNPELCVKMGEIGRKRLENKYKIEFLKEKYRDIYYGKYFR